MSLEKKFIKQGNSLALIIDRPILDLLGFEPDQPVVLETGDGKSLTLRPKEERTKAPREKQEGRKQE